MEVTDFLHASTDSCKLKVAWKFFGWAWSKMCLASLVMGLLKLTVSEEWTDRVTDFLLVDIYSQKLKASQIFFEWVWLSMGVTSLVISL